MAKLVTRKGLATPDEILIVQFPVLIWPKASQTIRNNSVGARPIGIGKFVLGSTESLV